MLTAPVSANPLNVRCGFTAAYVEPRLVQRPEPAESSPVVILQAWHVSDLPGRTRLLEALEAPDPIFRLGGPAFLAGEGTAAVDEARREHRLYDRLEASLRQHLIQGCGPRLGQYQAALAKLSHPLGDSLLLIWRQLAKPGAISLGAGYRCRHVPLPHTMAARTSCGLSAFSVAASMRGVHGRCTRTASGVWSHDHSAGPLVVTIM